MIFPTLQSIFHCLSLLSLLGSARLVVLVQDNAVRRLDGKEDYRVNSWLQGLGYGGVMLFLLWMAYHVRERMAFGFASLFDSAHPAEGGFVLGMLIPLIVVIFHAGVAVHFLYRCLRLFTKSSPCCAGCR